MMETETSPRNTTLPGSAIRHGDALHFNQEFRPREPCGGDERARREIVTEYFFPDFKETRPVTRVSDKHCHGHHVGKLGAYFLKRATKLFEYRPNLTVKIPRQGLSVEILNCCLAGEPDCPSITFGYYRA